MTEFHPTPGSVSPQPTATTPIRKRAPLLWVLVAIVVLIGIANLSSLAGGKSRPAVRSALVSQPATVSPGQVKSYQAMQANEVNRDAEARQQKAQIPVNPPQGATYPSSEIPGPEADIAAPMTAAQSQAIYGESTNAPQRTSGASQAHAEAQQRQLAREKLHQDALASDTVAIDFSAAGQGSAAKPATVLAAAEQAANSTSSEELGGGASPPAAHPTFQPAAVEHPDRKADAMSASAFDGYQGQLFRVFEGTVLEGVVTNHIDGAFTGPILVMLTTDYYSHNHQQLLMPQGTRLIGAVQGVNGQGQRKLMVVFHRAVCPDGFSLDFDKFLGLDPIGTTGLAGKVNNHYLSSFAAAAVIGGIGGLAQIGNSGGIITPSTEIRGGISQQAAQESEQILNKFLDRLPTITLKEGSRARVYIGRDILIPSYAQHRVDPTL